MEKWLIDAERDIVDLLDERIHHCEKKIRNHYNIAEFNRDENNHRDTLIEEYIKSLKLKLKISTLNENYHKVELYQAKINSANKIKSIVDSHKSIKLWNDTESTR